MYTVQCNPKKSGEYRSETQFLKAHCHLLSDVILCFRDNLTLFFILKDYRETKAQIKLINMFKLNIQCKLAEFLLYKDVLK